MPRLLLASNRLPVTASWEDGSLSLSPSAGGLATGLRGICRRDVLWVGWPGETWDLDEAARQKLDRELATNRLVPVHLQREEAAAYYDEISNGILWPLFHNLISQIPPAPQGWDLFVEANERFSEAVARQFESGDVAWVQDYHLALVPNTLRRRLPDATIGFFLHVPFPASDVFRVLPWREQILEGLLGADLIGFHTEEYLQNFAASAQRLLGLELRDGTIEHGGRRTRLGVFPMGIDAQAWQERGQDPDIVRRAEDLRREAADRSLLLGIDRLDYTKGILRRCLAVERLLAMDERLSDSPRLIQVTVPSREGVEAYANLGRTIDETVGRINAAYTSATAVPIHRIHRALSEQELSVLYRASDVMLVTPLRDGMNLVAKEFVASRSDEDGVLVLSEFAGAAAELKDALLVNPYDIEGTASVILRALTTPREERRERMRSLRQRVFEYDVSRWAGSFLEQLERAGSRVSAAPSVEFSPPEEIAVRLRSAEDLVLFLDYDGTLVPFADTPAAAAPDGELLSLLSNVVARPRTNVYITSGRTKDSLDSWFGHLPVGLHAEHGVWSRHVGGDWQISPDIPVDWMTVVRPILDQVAARVPTTFIEEKTAGYVWHYRMAAGSSGHCQTGVVAAQARELADLLSDFLAKSPAEVIMANGALEVRPRASNKGAIVTDSIEATGSRCLAAAIGDDEPDEDLFRALPAESITVRVGPGVSAARYRLRDVQDVRALLSALVR